MRFPCALLVPLAIMLAWPRLVSADPMCPTGLVGPLEVTPADGAANVTRDAYVAIRYSDGYFEESNDSPVETITLETEFGANVPGMVQQLGGEMLFFMPTSPLSPSTQYFGIATGPDGDFEFAFRTGTILDVASPLIREGMSDPNLEIRPAEVEPSCEAPDGGTRVGVTVTRASDDGPAGSVEYHLYLTRAPSLDAPKLVARARNFTSGDTMTLAFILPLTKAGTSSCVSLVVTDGVGHVSRWKEPVCFDPTVDSRFLGLCTQSVAPSGARGAGAPWVTVAIAGFGVVVRRRRRRPAGL